MTFYKTNKLICCVLFFLIASYANAQEVNTQGRDFWVSFLPNWPIGTPKLELLVAGLESCTGVATNPKTGWSTNFSVKPGEVTTIVIPNSEGLMLEGNKVENKAIHITTTKDVSLYASNFIICSYDVSNVLPANILTGNYIAQSYDTGVTPQQARLNSRMVIVATENDTQISVDPKGGLYGFFPSFVKRIITLNKGECYMFISASGDISGTTVNVKGGKKVAVFSGGDTQIPHNGCCYDAVFEQCIPLAYWGRHFVVTASAMRKNDIVRITSLSSGCRITIDGKHKKTIGAGKYYEYKLDGTKKEAIFVSTSKPVSVCLYLTSASMGGEMGDPSMVNINPIEQQMDKVTFASYNTAVSKFHYVNIVTQTNQIKGMILDGKSIASEFKPVPQKKEMSYARVSIPHGSHTLETTKGGFVAHIYGLGSCESYAYTVGSSSKVLNQFDEEGNLILSNIPDDPDDSSSDKEAKDEMPPTYNHTDTLPSSILGSISLEALKRDGITSGHINNSTGLIVATERFDISVESDFDYLFDYLDATINRDSVILKYHARSKWCDCFVPKELKANVILVPKLDEGDNTGRIVIPVVLPITRAKLWVERCLWVLIMIMGLVLFLIYLRALLKKNRFHKNARMKNSYVVEDSPKEVQKNGKRMRKPGFGAWLDRWMNPFGDEKNTINFTRPKTPVMTFTASESKNKVLLNGASYDKDSMTIPMYNPQAEDKTKKKKREPIGIQSGTAIEIKKNQGGESTRLGHVTYVVEGKDDVGGYRFFIGLTMALSILSFIALVIMLIRGIAY